MASAHVTILQFQDGREVCLSYGTPVAGFVPGVGAVQTDRRYSVTSSRHANQYTRATSRTVEIHVIPDATFRAHFPELATVVIRGARA